jgi:hypothetical protein
MIRRIQELVLFAVASLAAGCGALAFDIDKGTNVANLNLAGRSVIEREVTLEAGEVGFAIAVPGIKCEPTDDAITVQIQMKGNGASINESLRFGDLTWAFARDSCDAWGYVYTKTQGSKSLALGRGEYQVTIAVDAPSSARARKASLWIIYGDMAPTIRMFGSTANAH